jgi:Zn-dependent peptidase ImmA (M78 family)
MNKIEVSAEMLLWACKRSRVAMATLEKRLPSLGDWIAGTKQPTVKQLEDFAKKTFTPFGMLFLNKPPMMDLPIPDFRTVRDEALREPSPNLLDTVYLCQQRQEWYREYKRIRQLEKVGYVGRARVGDDVVHVAQEMRDEIGFATAEIKRFATWEEALRHFMTLIDDAGIMVMCSGIVANNTSRKLDPTEFRGFALSDQDAPLIFINGTDSKAAQMFTLAHELAHLRVDETGLSDADMRELPTYAVEQWCNKVAAEFLVPIAAVQQLLEPSLPIAEIIDRIRRSYKVSSLVAMRRIFDAGAISRSDYWILFEEEVSRIRTIQNAKSGGGDFYRSQSTRVSKRFASALVESTLEGHTLYRDAMKMLGISKVPTFNEFGRKLGYPA